jgi:hypothetical protein
MKPEQIEKKIIDAVRKSEKPQGPREVADKVAKTASEAKAAREAIRSLVARGVLEVDLDWKLQAL